MNKKVCYLVRFVKTNGRPTQQHFFGDSAEEVWEKLEKEGCRPTTLYERKLHVETVPAVVKRVEG